ncbi:MAG: GlsB/YeaQ/YmgE family stress response membrane protein [Alphaproteobacteria bacterium]|nr:MAG: GlsB/YeaQ/YmgE family stress response membrane protein [Alphaproteobacteria bacterium]
MFGLIGTAIVGLIVGGIAKWLSPGPKPDGCIVTILIGIAGAMIAKYVGSEVFGWYRDGDAPGWIMSVLGAVVLLWLYRLVRNRG